MPMKTKYEADLAAAGRAHQLGGIVYGPELAEASCVACPWKTTTTKHPQWRDRLAADHRLHLKLLVAAKNDRARTAAALRSNTEESGHAE